MLHPATGTPQGGIISPILANIYLHYVLAVWFETVVKVHCRGQAYLIRYADDFVCAFQCKDDAERFYRVLGTRLGTYGLTLAEDKTQLLRFSRHQREDKARFVFLGFEFRWTERWKTGQVILLKRTAPKKLRQSLRDLTEWCKTHRHWRVNHLMETVTAKLRGYFNYYGIRGNAKRLAYFYDRTMNILFKWLNRRSQKRSDTWEGFTQLLEHVRVPRPRIVQQSRNRNELSGAVSMRTRVILRSLVRSFRTRGSVRGQSGNRLFYLDERIFTHDKAKYRDKEDVRTRERERQET